MKKERKQISTYIYIFICIYIYIYIHKFLFVATAPWARVGSALGARWARVGRANPLGAARLPQIRIRACVAELGHCLAEFKRFRRSFHRSGIRACLAGLCESARSCCEIARKLKSKSEHA